MKSRRLLSIPLGALAALLVGACGKAPLVPDAPKGPSRWLPDVALACTTSTTDPSGAQVSYQFDWGDGSKSVWSQFMDGGVPCADTHTYVDLGSYAIKVRAKNSKKASGWSDPLSTNVVAEGHVVWSVFFTDPLETEDPDTAEFNVNSFAIGPDNTAYITCTNVGAVVAVKPSGAKAWAFCTEDPIGDEFYASPVVADDGTILVGCSNEFIYALTADGTVKWRDSVGSSVNATAAVGADGTSYFQTADSCVIALNQDGSTRWMVDSIGGNSSPVIGTDGTVYFANQDGQVHAVDPSDGSPKWTYYVTNAGVTQPLALDPSRNVLYVVTDLGLLQSVNLANGTGGSVEYGAGDDASAPVVGPDGTIYVGGGGKLTAVTPDGYKKWVFTPTLAGVVSAPAITVDGCLYVLVVADKKRLAATQGTDSLYAVNSDGLLLWACGLGEGMSDPEYALSAPKLDADGFIYVGDGTRAWCVAGVSAPAQSIWPMLQHDAQNTGRAQ